MWIEISASASSIQYLLYAEHRSVIPMSLLDLAREGGWSF